MAKFTVVVETPFVVEAENASEAFDMIASSTEGARVVHWAYPDRELPYDEDTFVVVYDFESGEKISG